MQIGTVSCCRFFHRSCEDVSNSQIWQQRAGCGSPAQIDSRNLDMSNLDDFESQMSLNGLRIMVNACVKNQEEIADIFPQFETVLSMGDISRQLFVRHICALKDTVNDDNWTDEVEAEYQNLLTTMPFKGESNTSETKTL